MTQKITKGQNMKDDKKQLAHEDVGDTTPINRFPLCKIQTILSHTNTFKQV